MFPKPNITSRPAGNEDDGHSNNSADAHTLSIHFFMSVRTSGAASLAAGLKLNIEFPLEISIIRHEPPPAFRAPQPIRNILFREKE